MAKLKLVAHVNARGGRYRLQEINWLLGLPNHDFLLGVPPCLKMLAIHLGAQPSALETEIMTRDEFKDIGLKARQILLEKNPTIMLPVGGAETMQVELKELLPFMAPWNERPLGDNLGRSLEIADRVVGLFTNKWSPIAHRVHHEIMPVVVDLGRPHKQPRPANAVIE